MTSDEELNAVRLSPKEMQAIKELAVSQELPEEKVVVQAVRLYQLYVTGYVSVCWPAKSTKELLK